MILKNSSGKERECIPLLEIEKDKNIYIIYKDMLTGNVYGGKKENSVLKILSDEEYLLLNNIVERINW